MGSALEGGSASREGVCTQVGSASRGFAARGVGQTPHIGYYGVWSISGRYASYWNAFLFSNGVQHIGINDHTKCLHTGSRNKAVMIALKIKDK